MQIELIEFLDTLPTQVKEDSLELIAMMEEVTGKPPHFAKGIIGFGTYQYTYASGHSGTSIRLGFAPRKAKTTLYLMSYYEEPAKELLSQLGKFKTGKGCLYLTKLSDVNQQVLKQVMSVALAELERHFGPFPD